MSLRKQALAGLIAFILVLPLLCWGPSPQPAWADRARDEYRRRDDRRLSPGAESRDPHWGGRRGSRSSTCSGVDLVVSRVEARRNATHGIHARATVINRCSGTIPRTPNVLYEVVGGGPGVTSGGSGHWEGLAGDPTTSRRITIRVKVDYDRRIDERDNGNNTCSVVLAVGASQATRVCYR